MTELGSGGAWACKLNGAGRELVTFIMLEHPVTWQEITEAIGEVAPKQR